MLQAVGRFFGRGRVQNGERPPDEPPIDPSTLTITGRAAIWSAQHRWWVTGAALLTVVLAIVASSQFDTVEFTENGEGESSTAADLLDDRFDSPAEKSPPTEQLVFSNPQLDAGTAEYQATVESLVTKLRSMPEVESVDSYYDNDDPGMLSADGTVVLARIIIDTMDESGAEPQRVSSRSRID
ncbi:MAG: MMPL family transporter, partial [SAR202 cluster bacterium]|nr:MMPL family transporter [SAR202 cluster bacterium]